ncbi:MAG: hypothetical protein MdMp014T_1523 [Treponematales bacterium]
MEGNAVTITRHTGSGGAVTIPARLGGLPVTSIGGGTFYRCTGLTSITAAAGNPKYSSKDGILFDKDAQFLLAYPGGKKGAYSIPNDEMVSI